MKKAEIFGGYKKMYYLCTRLQEVRALSSVGLEHLPYKQRVGGSTPSAPTKRSGSFASGLFFVLFSLLLPIRTPQYPCILLKKNKKTLICHDLS